MNSFELDKIWPIIQQTGTDIVGRFQSALIQLLFTSKQACNNAKIILAQLTPDLISNPAGNIVQIVNNATSKLNQLLANGN